jgi:hypothetical protein
MRYPEAKVIELVGGMGGVIESRQLGIWEVTDGKIHA